MPARAELRFALMDIDASLTTDEQLDPATLASLGEIATEWALNKLTQARALRRAQALADHPKLFVENVETEVV